MNLSFKTGRYVRRKTVIDKLADAGTHNVDDRFQRNDFCVLDCKSMISPLVGYGKSNCLLENNSDS